MNTLAPTLTALEKHCGFDRGRVRANVRALTEGGLLAPGAPGVSVQITEADFVLVLLAVASGAPLHAVAETVADLAATVPNGVDVEVMPAGIRPANTTAFDALHDLVWNAAHGDGSMRADLEVVETWREVALHTTDGVLRFQPAASLAGHWPIGKQRRATTIPSSALALAARALFAKDSK